MGDVVAYDPAGDENGRNRARRGRSAPIQAVGRTLPHSLEAEEYLLSCCMLDGADVLAKAYAAGVRGEKFYDSKHEIVWGALEKLWHKQQPTELSCVAEELKAARQLDAVGGYAFLTQVSSRVPTSAQASYFIEKVLEQAELREVIRVATLAVENCYNYSGGGLANDGAIVGALDRLQGARVKSQRDLPAIVSDGQLEAENLPEAPQLIEGVLHQGRRTLLLAPSKASKTWTAMDMSVAIASGQPWLGFRTHKGPMLHIDLELPTWDLKKRAAKIKEIRGIKGKLDVDWWSLDGYQRSIDELMPLITARATPGKYVGLVIEPAYVIMGKRDENDNADVTDFMNQLSWLARQTGAAVLCTHHFAKGDASKKEAKDRGSGAGAWMRAPDTAITLTPLAESEGVDCYSMEFIERSMKRHAPIGVRFEYPVFRLQSGLDLNALREAGRPKESTEADVVRLLGEELLTHGQWWKAVQKTGSKMSERTFNRRIEDAVGVNLVEKVGNCYRRKRADGGGNGS